MAAVVVCRPWISQWLANLSQNVEFSSVEEVSLNVGGAEFKIKPNRDAVNLAHRVWVELVTRKAALPFDRDHDVVVEVYDSLYTLFGEVREIAKQIPAHHLRGDSDLRQVVEAVEAILNHILRPHLTQWQARFRRWYDHELESSPAEDPQIVQMRFPDFELMVADLEDVNSQLVGFAESLRQIVYGTQKSRP